MIKVLIMSDSHGTLKNAEKVLKKEKKYDMVIHLGDIMGQDTELRNMCEGSLVIVRGNCDFYSENKSEEIITLGKNRIFATHGHRYGVDWGVDELCDKARECQCNIAMYGHTHVPDITYKGDMIALNPGSISRPRQLNGKATYGILTIDDAGRADVSVKYADD